MKLKIKTLNSRDFSVNLSDLKTVGELKRRICRMGGIWLHSDNQRLFYGGRELEDEKQLRDYCIDERKFLLMLPRKTCSQKLKKSSSATSSSTVKSSQTVSINEEAPLLPSCSPTDIIKNNIMKMGPWKESDVRQALLLSLNNQKRAIDYLTLLKAPFQIMLSPPPSNLFLTKSDAGNRESVPKPKNSRDIACLFVPFPNVEKLTSKAGSNTTTSLPKLKPNPNALDIPKNMHDIERLVCFGFSYDEVVDAYIACEGNIQRAAVLLYEEHFGEQLH